MSNLPAGYKQTEVGVIPEDWEIITAADACTKIQDGTHFSPKLGGNDYLYITSKNIRFGFLDISSAERITELQHRMIYRRCDVKNGDLLLTKDGANTGNAALNSLDEEFSLLSSVAFLRFATQKYLAGYFLQQILSYQGQKHIQDAMTGNAITRLTLEKINKLCFPLPPTKAEQTTIAAALSDADALIQSLGKLIAKQRLIKQGTMQELLTGKKRLAGFEGDWQEYELNELGIFKGGSGFPTKYQGLIEGKFPFYKVSDMNIEGNEVFMSNSNNYITEDIKKLTNTVVFPKNTIVFAKIGAAVFLERKKILTQESCIDNNMMGFILNATKCDINFFHSLFLSFKLSKLVSTIALPSLNGKEIGQLKFKIPKPEEQTAIATILADMDAEIFALETKLAKYKMVKQGMMQNLLTGKIRLV